MRSVLNFMLSALGSPAFNLSHVPHILVANSAQTRIIDVDRTEQVDAAMQVFVAFGRYAIVTNDTSLSDKYFPPAG